jgi:hypothetical protein
MLLVWCWSIKRCQIFYDCFCHSTASNPTQTIQHYVIKFGSDIQQVGGFSGYSGFLPQLNWPPRYSWNIVESGVIHHKPNHSTAILNMYFGIMRKTRWWTVMVNNATNINEQSQAIRVTVLNRYKIVAGLNNRPLLSNDSQTVIQRYTYNKTTCIDLIPLKKTTH